MSWEVTPDLVHLSSCWVTQEVTASLLVTSTVPTRFRISLAGSTTRTAYSPNARSVTTRPVCGSCTSSSRPPKRMFGNSRAPTKKISALKALLLDAQSMNSPRNGSSAASRVCCPGPSMPITRPWLMNTATASGSTMALENLRMLWSGHLKTIWPFELSGAAMNSRRDSFRMPIKSLLAPGYGPRLSQWPLLLGGSYVGGAIVAFHEEDDICGPLRAMPGRVGRSSSSAGRRRGQSVVRNSATSPGDPSATRRPARSTRTRLATSKTRGSWEARITPPPRWLTSRRASITTFAASWSISAVGSSARTMSGSGARARASATRCCCPSESSNRRCSARSSRPMRRSHLSAAAAEESGSAPEMRSGQVDVLARGQSREEAKGLEHHAELAGPPARQLGCGQVGERPPVPHHASAIRWFETSDYAEQGALSRARRPHEDDQLARRELQRDVTKGDRAGPAVAVRSVQLPGREQRCLRASGGRARGGTGARGASCRGHGGLRSNRSPGCPGQASRPVLDRLLEAPDSDLVSFELYLELRCGRPEQRRRGLRKGDPA